MRPLRALSLTFLVALFGLSGCRDAVEPLDLDHRPRLPAEALRLTYSLYDDRAPHWSADGDTIYYTASQFENVPAAPAVPLAIPADGRGPARTILRNVQVGNRESAWIGATALSHDGESIAYVELMPERAPVPCTTTADGCWSLAGAGPLPVVPLTSMVVHVREITSDEGIDQDPSISIDFAGYSHHADPARPTGGFVRSRYHEFQLQWVLDGTLSFRPSWAPDGETLVFSDGLQLLLWRPGSPEAVAVEGGDYGADPEWSSTGEFIAFTRAMPVDSSDFTCGYYVGSDETLVHACDEERIHYTIAPLEVVLIAPDGSFVRVLGHGREPAFSPDGQTVYFAAQYGVVAMRVDGGEAHTIDGTFGAREPSVSPDGERLAFSRRGPAGWDIWVVELP